MMKNREVGLNFMLLYNVWQVYKATQNAITMQPLYKWESEESQMTYLNLFLKS